MSRYIPPSITEAEKQGFSSPDAIGLVVRVLILLTENSLIKMQRSMIFLIFHP